LQHIQSRTTHIQIRRYRVKPHQSFRFLALSILGAFLSVAVASSLQAQIMYPTFQNPGNKVTSFQTTYVANDTNETYSPALASDANGKLWAAFFDRNTNLLSIASSTDAVNFTVFPTGIFMNSAPTWGTVNGNLYLVFTTNNSTISTYSLNNFNGTLTSSGDFNTGAVGTYARRPALAQFGSIAGSPVYLAWMANAYDPGSGIETGHWIDVTIATVLPGGNLSFSTPAFNYAPVSMAYTAGSGPALTLYNGQMFLTYLDGVTGYPQLFGVSTPGSTSFTDLTGPGGGNGHYSGDPATVSFDGALYAMFRSAFVDDELWAIGTFNGFQYGPSFEYGQSMKYSPSLTVTPNTNVLYQAEFTDFPSTGQYMWVYPATSATTNPFPEVGGGGGGGGGGGCAVLGGVKASSAGRVQPSAIAGPAIRPILPPPGC
jgi:hypothetical protein